jgi:hypothetical protein
MEGNAICLLVWHNGIMMPKRTSKKSKPTDIIQLPRAFVEEATGESLTDLPPPLDPPKEPPRKKNPAAVALGKLGGKKGGPARAKKLTAEQRKAIAQKAARTRWGNQAIG